ncbi:hypothetical protein T10_904 [Trichinella papuae]|uniref:Uncharacterized protein n=1 Tax=Trichinella papuae TaxID=268474 RepID=A0A0V1MX07_9BILA|nr:hypothetical protein T10_904 [Trichinella papuae]
MKLGRKNPVLCQAGLTVQPRTLAVLLCATVERVWLQFCLARIRTISFLLKSLQMQNVVTQCKHNVVKRSRVKIFGDFFQQAEFYIFHFGISSKSSSPFGAYRQHKHSLTNRFFFDNSTEQRKRNSMTQNKFHTNSVSSKLEKGFNCPYFKQFTQKHPKAVLSNPF